MARRACQMPFRAAILIAAVSFAAAIGEAFVSSGPVTSNALHNPGMLSIQAPVVARSRAQDSASLWKAGASLALLGLAVGLRPKPRQAKTHVVKLACASTTFFEQPRVTEIAKEIPTVTNLIDVTEHKLEQPRSCMEALEVPTIGSESCTRRPTLHAARCAGSSRFAGARGSRPRHARADRSAHRAVGERLVERPVPVVVPRSFDASSVRSKIQQGLRIPQSLRCGARSTQATHVCGSRTRGSIIEVEHVLQQAYDNSFEPAIYKMLSCSRFRTSGLSRRLILLARFVGWEMMLCSCRDGGVDSGGCGPPASRGTPPRCLEVHVCCLSI